PGRHSPSSPCTVREACSWGAWVPTARAWARRPARRPGAGGTPVRSGSLGSRVRLPLGGGRGRGVGRQLLAADDRQIHADLHGHRLAVDLDRRLVVDVPAEGTGGELLDDGVERFVVDGNRQRLGVLAELGPADGARRFLGHPSPPGEKEIGYTV